MPDQASARTLARALIETRVAACVSIGAGVESLYHWRGRIETSAEVTLVAKTRTDLYPVIEKAILAGHPYELPEILAVPAVEGLAPYVDWIVTETSGG